VPRKLCVCLCQRTLVSCSSSPNPTAHNDPQRHPRSVKADSSPDTDSDHAKLFRNQVSEHELAGRGGGPLTESFWGPIPEIPNQTTLAVDAKRMFTFGLVQTCACVLHDSLHDIPACMQAPSHESVWGDVQPRERRVDRGWGTYELVPGTKTRMPWAASEADTLRSMLSYSRSYFRRANAPRSHTFIAASTVHMPSCGSTPLCYTVSHPTHAHIHTCKTCSDHAYAHIHAERRDTLGPAHV
jgi:hypothetical protein